MEFKDMTAEELLTRQEELKASIDSPETDSVEKVAELRAEFDRIKAELEERENIAKQKAELRKLVAEGAGEVIEKIEPMEERKTMSNMEIRNSAEYISAFANYVKSGDDAECRSLLTENVSGTVPVPEFVAGIVAEKLKASKILSRVRHMNAGGNVKVGFEISAPAAGTHTEGDEAIDEEELVTGIVTLIPTTYKKWVSISDEALDSMSGQAYLEYVYEEVARGIIKARENAVVAAILAAPQTATSTAPAVAKTGSAAGAITDFIDARALLSSAAEDLVIIITPAQYATYKGLAIAANYAVDPFDGIEVIFNDTVTYPIIGDLNGVMENLPKGDSIEFKYDDKTRMKLDLVDILGRQPSAIGVVGNLYFAMVSA